MTKLSILQKWIKAQGKEFCSKDNCLKPSSAKASAPQRYPLLQRDSLRAGRQRGTAAPGCQGLLPDAWSLGTAGCLSSHPHQATAQRAAEKPALKSCLPVELAALEPIPKQSLTPSPSRLWLIIFPLESTTHWRAAEPCQMVEHTQRAGTSKWLRKNSQIKGRAKIHTRLLIKALAEKLSSWYLLH